eukprot:gnl/MRDRNA2_/MRDRNA2_86203_c0_seq1.p1 gnl/MRDRNA2_/MRDRNA2_86203_c0~~gnl/MRDRNA2_/MRDRNA2_86203_c0_seq1.p1  ORF type:complete len:299 (+),score=28.67 gnl/MRDRNA2_/MRDRNA2_86203_c0_seq1:104-1000(+)
MNLILATFFAQSAHGLRVLSSSVFVPTPAEMRVAIVRPFYSHGIEDLIVSLQTPMWKETVCPQGTAGVHLDHIFYFDGNLNEHPDVAEKLEEAIRLGGSCFESTFSISGGLSEAGYPAGPNRAFKNLFLNKQALGLEKYQAFFYMEHDMVPINPQWLTHIKAALVDIASENSPIWQSGPRVNLACFNVDPKRAPPSLKDSHINGNSIFKWTSTEFSKVVETIKDYGTGWDMQLMGKLDGTKRFASDKMVDCHSGTTYDRTLSVQDLRVMFPDADLIHISSHVHTHACTRRRTSHKECR